ncbi:MAG: primosomal protein N' [Cyanobacteria bacterium P01_H01_bin.74]
MDENNHHLKDLKKSGQLQLNVAPPTSVRRNPLLPQNKAPLENQFQQVVEVLLTIIVQGLSQPVFSYTVPQHFSQTIVPGLPVLVSFGAQHNVTGFILNTQTQHEKTQDPYVKPAYQLKPIKAILSETPVFDSAYYQLMQWVAQHYATPLATVLQTALPANLIDQPKKRIVLGQRFYDPNARSKIKNSMAPLAQRLFTVIKTSDAKKKPEKSYSARYLSAQCKTSMAEINGLVRHLSQLDILAVHYFLEPAVKPKSQKLIRKMVYPNSDLDWVNVSPDKNTHLSQRQLAVLNLIKEFPDGIELSGLLQKAKTTPAMLKKLADKASIRICLEETDPVKQADTNIQESPSDTEPIVLSKNQEAVFNQVLQGDNAQPYLLFGVTGSGKTEVYIRLTQQHLKVGKSVMVLLPEIALTSQIAKRFVQYFGPSAVALWHSNLSQREKITTWNNLKQGLCRIVIGARSAIWTPVDCLGLIIIDEEHETSYKQDAPAPRYNAKIIAQELAKRHGAKLLLGSATPEITTYTQALKDNRLLVLSERFGNKPLASVSVVDMIKARSEGNKGQLCQELKKLLAENLAAGNQSIILLNRRGYYTLIQCAVCDFTAKCPNCEVALTYHRSKNIICCHYCGYTSAMLTHCPVCTSMEIIQTGAGTQRIEAELGKLFPEARLLRIDSDILRRKNAFNEIFSAFAAGEADILIGTQVVAKGLDVANVTLVGVVNADSAFIMPDFKSAERGFQLLAQVAGRAGRGSKPGKVILQTCQPKHPVLAYAQNQDFTQFYQYEIQCRKEFSFPPFSQLFRIVVSSENDKKALQYISTLAMRINEGIGQKGLNKNNVDFNAFDIQVIGPAPCVISRIQGLFRYHILIKNKLGKEGQAFITNFYTTLQRQYIPQEIRCILDIDVYSLL